MSETEYVKMIEVPMKTCDVVVKPTRRKKKTVVDEVIDKVNKEEVSNVVKPFKYSFFKKGQQADSVQQSKSAKKVKKVKIEQQPQESSSQSVTVKSGKFDIVSVQVVAIFALIVGIILTNIFWEDSGINTLMKQVFKKDVVTNSATYTSFVPNSPSKSSEVTIADGVMTVSSGAIYSPCDGEVESVSETDGKYTVVVRHSDSFTTVVSGLEFVYAQKGESVYGSIPIGFSSQEVNLSMFNNDAILTGYLITDNQIVWLT